VTGQPTCRGRPASLFRSQTSVQNLEPDWPVPTRRLSCYARTDVIQHAPGTCNSQCPMRSLARRHSLP